MFFSSSSKLFKKDIEPRCAYCARGTAVGEREIACKKNGITDPASHCRSFVYDPLKREPPRPLPLKTEHLTADDFLI